MEFSVRPELTDHYCRAMAKKQKRPPKISNEVYAAEIFRLQTELVKLQEWTRQTGARILVIFEGRDAAGKGGAIKRITEYLSPRVAADRRAADPDRTRARPVVLPALHRPPAQPRAKSCSSTAPGTTAPA